MNIEGIIAQELNIQEWQSKSVVKLIDEGNTIPFISRYRKEATGSLDDEVLRKFEERLNYLRNLEERKQTVIKAIDEQGKLTEELRAEIEKAMTLVEVEDLYRPYKLKKKTRAAIAKEKGLLPLADQIWEQNLVVPIEEIAEAFINEEKGVLTVQEAITGAKDILAERISDEPEYRKWIRKYIFANGTLKVERKTENESSVYTMYADYKEPVRAIPGHRILAMNRGENEKELSVKIEIETQEEIDKMFYDHILKIGAIYTEELMKSVIQDAYERLIFPSIDREIRNELTEKAEIGAIQVFSKNLKQILMQQPIVNQVVLGLDPAYRTGCKLAVVDSTSKVLATKVIYPTPPHNQIAEASKSVLELIKKHSVNLISIGNGTASRESEKFIADLIKENKLDIQYIIVNEAGASVYSASKLATEEFPDFDVAERSAVSIARRLQDPLAELVKIEPKAIGVGQYQHDMNQKNLKENLDHVVEDVVNNVGVDLNTASASLLKYVSGVNDKIAKSIVDHREKNDRFKNREELKKVKGLGPKAFEQCAGFLRIADSTNVLDSTAVHPESYKVVEGLLKELSFSYDDVKNKSFDAAVSESRMKELADKIQVGVPTLTDILKELKKPGRDPRSEMPTPVFRNDILEFKDLRENMVLEGVVRNLVDFGVFVDIGVHQDGMVHISEITDKYIKHPLEVLNIGDTVKVKVLGVDEVRKRISLTMKI